MALKILLSIAVVVGVIVFVAVRLPQMRRDKIVKLVKEKNVQPGDYQYEDGKFIKHESRGRIRVIMTSPHLLISFDDGGGHLGATGYVYSENPDVDVKAVQMHFGEGLKFEKQSDHWWHYKER